MITRLRWRWHELWQAIGLAQPPGVLDDLLLLHSAPARYYHTLEHIAECFERVDEMRALALHPSEVELALWFHDAVYDVRRHDNEKRSAHLAHRALQQAGMDDAVIERVCSHIMATCHRAAPPAGDAAIVVDADLAILAAEPARFDAYERQIRAEYSHVPASVFAEKRKEVLAGFLQRESIFSTALFYSRYEAAARSNLQRALETGGNGNPG